MVEHQLPKLIARVRFPSPAPVFPLVALTGATLPELMQRAGHSTPRAALHYQHAADDAQHRIAERLDAIAPRRA
jgi:hypothetical protein